MFAQYSGYAVIKGQFYDSDRFSKSEQTKVVTYLSYLLHYSYNCQLLFKGSEEECKNFSVSQNGQSETIG